MLDLFYPPKVKVRKARAVPLLRMGDEAPKRRNASKRVFPTGRPTHPRTPQDNREKYRRYVEKWGREYINMRRRIVEGLRKPLPDGTRGPVKPMEVRNHDLKGKEGWKQAERIAKRQRYWTDPQYREAVKARARAAHAAKKAAQQFLTGQAGMPEAGFVPSSPAPTL